LRLQHPHRQARRFRVADPARLLAAAPLIPDTWGTAMKAATFCGARSYRSRGKSDSQRSATRGRLCANWRAVDRLSRLGSLGPVGNWKVTVQVAGWHDCCVTRTRRSILHHSRDASNDDACFPYG
jgi:hypothetical protein